jgi:hypothetical protein
MCQNNRWTESGVDPLCSSYPVFGGPNVFTVFIWYSYEKVASTNL